MNRLKNKLLYLGLGEFAAVCTFIYVYRLSNRGMASFIAFSYLIFIILQGSIYWFYRYILIIKKENFDTNVIRGLRFLRKLNLILLVAISIIIPITRTSNKNLIISIALLLFGIVEYINYYWYRLSYGKSGFNIKMLLSKRLKKSSINKLLAKYC